MTNKELAEKMIVYRAKHNLTLKEFAEKVGVTFQTVRMIESGRQNPSRLTATKILLVLEGE